FGEEHLSGANGALTSAPGERFELGLSEDGKGDFLFAGHARVVWRWIEQDVWCGVARGRRRADVES
ncbi:MAG TPA: hypothetical protein VKP02_00075, partial [Gemmatimonadaceae bacterium]|nr:hypothetical protein [Gemmatimonadaceae bacterium]